MIHLGESFDILKTIKSGTVDCIITDPPYQGFGINHTGKGYNDWFAPYIREFYRVCGEHGAIAISQPPARHGPFKRIYNYENILCVKNAYQQKNGQHAFFLTMKSPNTLEEMEAMPTEDWPNDIVPASIHPNDRSINKMAKVVKAMSKPGDIILDPFCGSGAIGVASILLGRRYIGIELIPDRARDAQARLEQAEKQAEKLQAN